MSAPALPSPETDPRFPSGPWTGFFLQKLIPGRHLMELRLTFTGGTMTGAGRDWAGNFVIQGRYDLASGECHWTKRYVGKHDVFYRGFNEGKGIWGTWELPNEPPDNRTGGFHIWPEGMPDPTAPHASEAVEEPIIVEPTADVDQTEAVPAGTRA
ncbi:MAG: hypothetical protein JNM56_12680 [Planctomycetia bacterium]|nr:hypothetical protein [Planctomycetia bacterium]